MAQIKGTALRGLLRHAKEGGHPGGVAGLVAQLPDSSRAVFDRRILASNWYPYEVYADLLNGFVGSARDRTAYLHQLGRLLAKQDAGSTLKVVALFGSVERLLQRAAIFWSRHCDTGTFDTVEPQPGSRATVVLRDFPGISPLHCTLMTGWIEGIAEAAGATRAHAEKVRCVHRGDAWCEYRGTWE